jgi:hypothetical protein
VLVRQEVSRVVGVDGRVLEAAGHLLDVVEAAEADHPADEVRVPEGEG